MKVSLRPLALMCLGASLFFASCSTSEYNEDQIAPNQNKTEAAAAAQYDYTPNELALLHAINNHRSSMGLSALQIQNYVSLTSKNHNEYMIANDAVNHDNFSARVQDLQQSLGAESVGENLAYNFSTPQSVLHAWLQSPEHRAHIEGNFTHFGLSIRTDQETGNLYYTNIFVKI